MAAQPQPAARPVPVHPVSTVMLFVAAVCFFIAALRAADAFTATTAWDWGFGGLCAAALAGTAVLRGY